MFSWNWNGEAEKGEHREWFFELHQLILCDFGCRFVRARYFGVWTCDERPSLHARIMRSPFSAIRGNSSTFSWNSVRFGFEHSCCDCAAKSLQGKIDCVAPNYRNAANSADKTLTTLNKFAYQKKCKKERKKHLSTFLIKNSPSEVGQHIGMRHRQMINKQRRSTRKRYNYAKFSFVPTSCSHSPHNTIIIKCTLSRGPPHHRFDVTALIIVSCLQLIFHFSTGRK